MLKAKGKGSFLTRKQFGLPIWAWAGITAIVVYILYQRYKNNQAASTTDTTAQPLPNTDPNTTTVDTSGGSTGGTGDGSGTGTQPPPTTTPPPANNCVTIWIHGNPGHPAQYCGDTTQAGWVQLNGQWIYFVPGGGPTGQGNAYTPNDPGLPAGAGSPPGQTATSSAIGDPGNAVINGNAAPVKKPPPGEGPPGKPNIFPPGNGKKSGSRITSTIPAVNTVGSLTSASPIQKGSIAIGPANRIKPRKGIAKTKPPTVQKLPKRPMKKQLKTVSKPTPVGVNG